MSKYNRIATQFKTLDSLLRALADVGVQPSQIQVAPEPKTPTLAMYGYHNDRRPELASVRIDRKFVSQASNDVGFAWDPESGTYQAIISDFDRSVTWPPARLDKLRQRYALHEIRRSARLQGYTIREDRQEDGSIRVICSAFEA